MLTTTLVSIGIVIFTFVTFLFIVSLIVKRNDIADIAWGVGIMLVALVSYMLHTDKNILVGMVVLLIALWGTRLSVRIFLRNIRKGEDYRYKAWREEWGSWFYVRSYFQIYLLQGLLMMVVGFVAIHASVFANEEAFGVFTLFGIAVWFVGYFFEVVGDYQLDAFLKSKPKEGDILTTGLWKYTRHPNYFGEVTMWWGLWLIISPLAHSYLALISPLMITFLILKVSGIPMLEKRFEGNAVFEEYKRKTNAFFPWKPKS